MGRILCKQIWGNCTPPIWLVSMTVADFLSIKKTFIVCIPIEVQQQQRGGDKPRRSP
jgi:hypothetical protein